MGTGVAGAKSSRPGAPSISQSHRAGARGPGPGLLRRCRWPAVDILITEDEIRRRVGELARRIEDDYRGKPLTIVAVLTGSLVLLADLIRRIELPLRVALLQ